MPAGDVRRPVHAAGFTERLKFLHAPAHAPEPARHRTRGFAAKGDRIVIVKGRPIAALDILPPSVHRVEKAGVMVENYPPASYPLLFDRGRAINGAGPCICGTRAVTLSGASPVR